MRTLITLAVLATVISVQVWAVPVPDSGATLPSLGLAVLALVGLSRWVSR
jgi:hypothetical protein